MTSDKLDTVITYLQQYSILQTLTFRLRRQVKMGQVFSFLVAQKSNRGLPTFMLSSIRKTRGWEWGMFNKDQAFIVLTIFVIEYLRTNPRCK